MLLPKVTGSKAMSTSGTGPKGYVAVAQLIGFDPHQYLCGVGGAMGGHFYTLFQQYLIHFFPSACALLWTILYTLESHDIDDTSISIDGAHFHAIINNKYHSLCCLFLTCFSLVDL